LENLIELADMKIHLLFFGLFISTFTFSQVDTTFYFDGDYSVSLIKDSCTLKSKPINYPYIGFVALGNSLFLCDRIYFKRGVKYDQKKSFDFGYIYLQFDSTGLVRLHEYYNQQLNTHLSININNNGSVFWGNFKAKNYTNYLLYNNGRFQEINTTLTNNNDSLSNELYTNLKKYTNAQIANQWLNPKNNMKVNFVVTFLPGGLLNNAGYQLTQSGKPTIRFGKWMIYNLFCDCYQTKEYFSK
jgi:hypothetical protein